MSTRIIPGQNGLQTVLIEIPQASAQIYLLGATLTSCKIGEREILFVSKASGFQLGTAIRGGVPICFPWFGPNAADPKLPQHGFARTRLWTVEEQADAHCVLKLASSDETRQIWPHDFEARFKISLTETSMTMALTAKNTGQSAFRYGEALHTYFDIGDVRRTTVSGLEGLMYIDKNDGMKSKPETAAKVLLSGAADRVYGGAKGPHLIESPAGKLRVSKSGSADTVVWNPAEKAETIKDLAGNQWPGFICVEAVNTGDHSISLAPGESHTTSCVIEVT